MIVDSIVSHKGELATVMEPFTYVQISVTNILCRVGYVCIDNEYNSKLSFPASKGILVTVGCCHDTSRR